MEDENLRLQGEIASNVRQFYENEKNSEDLLELLDEVGVSLKPRGFGSTNMQALRDWERLPRDDMMQWIKDMQRPSISDEPTMI